MLHKNREYGIIHIEKAGGLAEKLTSHTWCGCNGFEHKGYFYLNDSTSPDGAQEYAIFKGNKQIESITFGWCTYDKVLKYIERISNGEFDESVWSGECFLKIVEAKDHKRCHCCM